MRWFVYMAVFLLAASIAYAEGSLKATVDRASVRAGEMLMLTIEARGSDVEEPIPPEVDGLAIDKRPSRRADQMNVVLGGARTVVKMRGFVVRTTRAGAFRIPPVTAVIDGKVLATPPIDVTVTDNAAAPQSLPSHLAGVSQADPGVQPNRSPTFEDIVFAEASTDKREACLGEQITLTLSLWVLNMEGVGVEEAQQMESPWPSTEGFYAVPQTPQRISDSLQQRNGWQYHVIQFRQMLYPTSVGDLTIGSWTWQGYARAFTQMGVQRKEYSIVSPPIAIKAMPLPERPPSFAGAVGQFDITANMASLGIVQGVPAKLTVRITGRGNPDAIGDPVLPKIPGAYVGEPEKQSNPVIGPDAVSVEKTFTYGITPQQAGTLEVPPFDYSYFNPATRQFVVQTLGPFTVNVAPSTEPQQRILTGEALLKPEANAVQVVGHDIQPIRSSAARRLHRVAPSPLTVPAATALPPLAYAVFTLYVRRKRRFEHDAAYARAYRAHSRAAKRIEESFASSEPATNLFRALSGYAADIFNAPENGITAEDVEHLFSKHGMDPAICGQFSRVFRACDRARYAGASLTQEEIRALIDAAHAACKAAEAFVKKGGVS